LALFDKNYNFFDNFKAAKNLWKKAVAASAPLHDVTDNNWPHYERPDY